MNATTGWGFLRAHSLKSKCSLLKPASRSPNASSPAGEALFACCSVAALSTISHESSAASLQGTLLALTLAQHLVESQAFLSEQLAARRLPLHLHQVQHAEPGLGEIENVKSFTNGLVSGLKTLEKTRKDVAFY